MCFLCFITCLPGPRYQSWRYISTTWKSEGSSRPSTTHFTSPITAPHWSAKSLQTFYPTVSPLSNLLRNRKKKNEQISLDTNDLKVFNEVKQKLAKTSLLDHPAPGIQFSLVIDASVTAVGAVLQHQQLQPLAYFSKQLKLAEWCFSTFGYELLAMYLAMKNF